MEQAAYRFCFDGVPIRCEPLGMGHINRTYQIVTDRERRYVLQRISRTAFHDIPGLMENIAAVTAALAQRSPDPRSVLRLIPASDGGTFWTDGEGEAWRAFAYVEDSICLQTPRDAGDFAQSAAAFGRFQRLLRDFPAGTLHETIPDFHNTPARFRRFRQALAADVCGRAASVRPEIEFLLSREEECCRLQALRDSGELPLRVTHNDTKLNNVLLDAKTRQALCVIDLDTVMPGLVAYDFGDAIRFGASTAAEDETDLSRVSLSLPMFRAFADAFIPACGGLTDREIETLPLGAKTITAEQGLRFLTDYLEGDVYYSVSRPEHNLLRARTQLRLVADMEKKWDGMQAAAAPYLNA